MSLAFLLLMFIAVFQLWWVKNNHFKKSLVNRVNIFCALSIIFSAVLLFYPHYKSLTKPQDEKWSNKKTPVSENDIKVLKRVNEFLNSDEHWDKNRDRHCLVWEKKSLFCAIALAQKEVDGKYRHGSVPIQHIRFTIDGQYPERWKIHPIMEFNNHKETTFIDVKNVISATILRIEKRLKEQSE